MQLTVTERLLLLNILPPQGNVLMLRIIQELKTTLSFTEAEHREIGFWSPCVDCGKEERTHSIDGHPFVPAPGRVNWSQEADVPREISIGPKAFSLIAETLEKLNKSNQLQLEHLVLYDKFCLEDKVSERLLVEEDGHRG